MGLDNVENGQRVIALSSFPSLLLSQSNGRRGLRISYSRTALSTKSKLYREAENGLQNIVKKDLGRAWQNSKNKYQNLTKPGARHQVNLFITLLLACRVQKFVVHVQLGPFVQ